MSKALELALPIFFYFQNFIAILLQPLCLVFSISMLSVGYVPWVDPTLRPCKGKVQVLHHDLLPILVS